MIRHLRWKVVATNMLLLSLVLLIMFAAVFFISRGNYRKNVQQQLNQALEQGDYGINQPGMDSIPCFVAEVYGGGQQLLRSQRRDEDDGDRHRRPAAGQRLRDAG